MLCENFQVNAAGAVEMHSDIWEEPLYANIFWWNAASQMPWPRPTVCASLRSRNAHGHVTRTILCEKHQEKCNAPEGFPDCNPHFVQACAVETHMDMSQESMSRDKCRTTNGVPWLSTGPKSYHGNRSVWTHCLGKNFSVWTHGFLRSWNAHGHVARIILCENWQGTCRAPDGSRDRDLHFVRACAVKMNMDMSQEPSRR